MAVPAVAEKQASAGNGFSAQGALDASLPEGSYAYDANAMCRLEDFKYVVSWRAGCVVCTASIILLLKSIRN